MKRNEPVRSIMTRDVVTVQVGEPPSKVRALLSQGQFHHVPVLDGRTLVGVVSSVDFMKANLSLWGTDERAVDSLLDAQLTLRKMMQDSPVTVRDNATVRDAAQALAHGRFHSLPVVDEAGEVAGIVTSTDLILYLLEQY